MSMLQLLMLGGGGEASYSVSESTTALDEGSTVAITLTTANVPDQTYYWEIVTVTGTIDASDFVGNSSTGSFSTTGGVGSFNLTLASDFASESTESFQVRCRKDSNSGVIVATTNTITVTNTSSEEYTITPSVANINEGSSVDFVVNTNGIANSTTLYYSLSTLDLQDLSTGSLTGSLIISGASGVYNTGGSATVTIALANDLHTEGADSVTFHLRTGSTAGPIVASSTVTINDTSLGEYTVTPDTTSIYEDGGSVTFNISTNPSRANTTLYYTLGSVQGTIDNNDFSSGNVSGSFTTDGSGNASLTYTAKYDGDSGDGHQIFTFSVRLGSITGRIVATSSNVTITESTAQISYQVYAAGGGGGGGVSSNTCGGGGGAGEYLSGNLTAIVGSPFPINCGAKGIGGYGWYGGNKGSDSNVSTITAKGGGAGRVWSNPGSGGDVNGGSGGGGNGGNGGGHAGGNSQPGGNPGFKGNSVGDNYNNTYGFGGGGGGAGSGGPPSTENKNGGSGIYAPLFGTTVCGGGGGGSNSGPGGSGGPGGGGSGGGGTATGGYGGSDATTGTGSGGGGAAVRGTGPTYAGAGDGSDGRVAISKPSSFSWGPFSGLTYSSPSPNIRIITDGNGTASVTL